MASWTVPPLPPVLAASRHLPLVGRRYELEAFETIWPRAEQGNRQVVFVGGEPGAGKTRLAAEIAGALHDHGAVVLLGTSSPVAGVPYQPFTEILDYLFTATEPGALSHLLGGRAAELGRLSSHVRHHHPSLNADHAETTEVRRELFDAVAGFLAEVAREHPLVLVLEDLNWSKPPTLALVDHVIHSCVAVPMLVVATFRSTPPDRSDQLTALVAELHRLEGVRRLDLGGLDTEAIAEYVGLQGRLPVTAAREAAVILRDRTGGNPFFLRELWLDLENQGGLAALRSRHRVPASIGDTLDKRLSGLGDKVIEVLELAAVIGDTFDIATLVSAGDEDRVSNMNAIDSAMAVGLISPVERRDGVYAFVHSLTRQAVIDRLASSRLAALHARVAGALESHGTDPSLTPRRAHHYLAAHVLGYHTEAVHHASEAARLAEASLAYEEAAIWFERAASLPESDPATQADMLLGAASNHLRAGDFQRARTIYVRLASASSPETRLAAAVGYEDANWRPGVADSQAADLLTSAIASSGLDDDDPRYVRALGSLGRALAFEGQHERAREVGSRAIDLARHLGDPSTISHTLKTSLWHGLTPEMAKVQLQRSTELSIMARQRGDYDTLGSASYFRAMVSYLCGRPHDLEEAMDDTRRSSMGSGQPFFRYIYACMAQGRAFMSGDFQAAESWAGTTLELGGSFGEDTTEGSYGVQMFMIRSQTGGLEQFRPLVNGRESFEGHWVPGLLALYTALDITDGIHRSLRHLLNRDLTSHTTEAQWPIELIYMIEGALALGDEEAAQRLKPLIAAFEGMNVIGGQFVALFGSADRYLGRLAALAGDQSTAERHFSAAQTMDRKMGAAAHLAETLAHHSAVTARFGDAERAKQLAEEAHSIAAPIAQACVLRLIDSLNLSKQPAWPDGLTEREVDVLRLLAEGLSNREIGERLYISNNTAANHVRSILIKTGASNRTQAAMYATEHDLA